MSAVWNLICPTTTYSFSNFPNAIVAFGTSFSKSDHEKFQEHIGKLKIFKEALECARKCGKHLQTLTQIAGKFSPVLNVMFSLVGEVDELYKELKNTEQDIFNTILEGKIRAITYNLKNLENTDTTEVQKVAEIVNVISHFNEMLPVFANKDSVFRVRFNQGAPLFVRLCVILKAISMIAESTTHYNTSNLQYLNQEYQIVLEWYRKKCIGSRMASCYVKKMLSIKGDHTWTDDWDRHYGNYKAYYDENTRFPWFKYGQNLGGDGWRLWCGQVTFCTLIDPWDTRTDEEVKFEPLDIENTSAKKMPNRDIEYHRDALAEYRRRVEKVMSEFFDASSLLKIF